VDAEQRLAVDDLAPLRLLPSDPAAAIFGAKKKQRSRSIPIYGYDDHSVWLVSSQYQDAKGLKLTARIFNVDATEKFSKRSDDRRSSR